MKIPLDAYLECVRRGGDHLAAVTEAAESLYHTPWDAVRYAGLLARCTVEIAPADLGLTPKLDVRVANGANVIENIPAGSPYPVLRHPGRRKRGTYDTPVDMARRVVQASSVAVEGPLRSGLDPACGTGAFLVAMLEAGIKDVRGTDIDEAALAVARVAAPRAKIEIGDALRHGDKVDLVVGNPPFVPPERQDKYFRADLRRRFPWLKGRFDLVVPFAAMAVERCRAGGATGIIMPAASLVQPYGAVLRRRWLERHEVVDLSGPYPFPGASVDVMIVIMRADRGPKPLPIFMIPPDELLRLDNVPFNPKLWPGDVDLVEKIRSSSISLGEFCRVDTGVVAHGSTGGKNMLISTEPGEGKVPYADARDFFEGNLKWLDYKPKLMHRPKSPEMFEKPKIVVQRIRGKRPIRAAIDWDGVYVGHTCTVVVPEQAVIPLDRILDLIRSPVVDAVTRIERGQRLDLYPRDVAAFPVPTAWLDKPHLSTAEAWNLTEDDLFRIEMMSES